ncbi:hypothetical protein NKI12_14375 [Mesorhizobium australicum]|uniref:Uncharacterized protein n=1 Tax=Mesorhizobium australicum TaxID=536018 RepID=A0ACC6T1N6_9HYPH
MSAIRDLALRRRSLGLEGIDLLLGQGFGHVAHIQSGHFLGHELTWQRLNDDEWIIEIKALKVNEIQGVPGTLVIEVCRL